LRFFSSLIIGAVLVASASARADDTPRAGDTSIADEWSARARTAHLADSEEWHRLGHWRHRTFGGYESEADGPDFFLAARGKEDPEAELEATVRGFFGPDPAEARLTHPICRFPARLIYLAGALSLDVSKLPQKNCAKFDAYWDKLRPHSIRLIFSSYYLNNPASAFGHTFLRVERTDPYTASERRELLDHGIDFSADVDTGNAVLYAFKGLVGLFPGTYKLRPYFYKVREYNDYESRDLWEYELALDQRQVALVIAHLWELGSTYFDYYYITENCAYQILAALEVADPRFELLRHVKTPVLPVDTVKALLANPGLVRRVRYRPSIRDQFARRIEGLRQEDLDAVEDLAIHPDRSIAELPVDRQVRVLDAALDFIDVRSAKELIDDPTSAAKVAKQRLEERRAALAVPSPELPPPSVSHLAPELSHASSRVGLGSGATLEQGGFASLGFRLALHDLADPVPGFPEYAQIEFMKGELRFHYQPHRVELENLSLISVVSLNPFSQFNHRISWKLDVGATRIRDKGCASCVAGTVQLAGGPTADFGSGRVVLFALAETTVSVGPALDGIGGTVLRAGAGPLGGMRLRWTERFITLLTADWLFLPWQRGGSTWSLSGTTRWELGRDVALGLEGRKQPLGFEGQLVAYFYY
jgi:hypothetical protein